MDAFDNRFDNNCSIRIDHLKNSNQRFIDSDRSDLFDDIHNLDFSISMLEFKRFVCTYLRFFLLHIEFQGNRKFQSNYVSVGIEFLQFYFSI